MASRPTVREGVSDSRTTAQKAKLRSGGTSSTTVSTRGPPWPGPPWVVTPASSGKATALPLLDSEPARREPGPVDGRPRARAVVRACMAWERAKQSAAAAGERRGWRWMISIRSLGGLMPARADGRQLCQIGTQRWNGRLRTCVYSVLGTRYFVQGAARRRRQRRVAARVGRDRLRREKKGGTRVPVRAPCHGPGTQASGCEWLLHASWTMGPAANLGSKLGSPAWAAPYGVRSTEYGYRLYCRKADGFLGTGAQRRLQTGIERGRGRRNRMISVAPAAKENR